MKFVHAADLHVGKSRRLPGYLERQDRMMAEIYRLAAAETDGLVVLAGDLYDRLDLTAREKDLIIRHVCRADEAGITTVLIAGNHDMIDQDDGGYTHVRALALMARAGRLQRTHVVETQPACVPLDDFGVVMACVPANYRRTGEVNAIMAGLIDQAGLDRPIVAVVHETIRGSANERGQRFGVEVGDARHCVDLDGSLPVQFWALGDIHVQQQIPGVPHAWYSGAPIQHDFGDSPGKGVLIVDIDRPTEPQHRALAGIAPLVTVDVDAGETVPEHALVRLTGTRARLAELVVPDNVVQTRPVVVTGSRETAFRADDLLAGLRDVLVELGLSGDDLEWGLAEAERLRG